MTTENAVSVIKLNGVSYTYDALIKVGKAGPVADIDIGDINPKTDAFVVYNEPTETSDKPLFYKFEGKWIILAGRANFEQQIGGAKPKTKINGKIISPIAIKTARIGTPAIFNQPAVTTAPETSTSYPSEYANRPRFTDQRKPRPEGFVPREKFGQYQNQEFKKN